VGVNVAPDLPAKDWWCWCICYFDFIFL